ncbi:MAG: DUF255 domain-containing protein [Candidatus Eisenbacteria bacterium]|nr:DUF255 domain-containing protein [Candidatus Eisenbacteria bacterium]
MEFQAGRRPTFRIRRTASLLALAVLVCTAPRIASADPAPKAESLKWLPYEVAVQEAAKSKKPILVDVYTNWCGWCKRMDATTYKDARVIEDLNRDFVIVRLNAESERPTTYKKQPMTEQQISRDVFGVSGFPTTIFLDADQGVIGPLPGYVQAAEFHNILRYIGGGHYKTIKYSEFKARKL